MIPTSSDCLLDVRDLRVSFQVSDGVVSAVRGLHLQLHQGETLAIVGESGCGKSVSMLAMMGLLPGTPAVTVGGSVRLGGEEILGLDERRLSRIRGHRVGMIFQDPMSALNPTMTIGDQIAESLHLHLAMARRPARLRAVQLLERTGIAAAAKRASQYPYQFSGGMLQRAMIAMSLACEPQLLIADEPTTALDVTTQDQVLELIRELQRDLGMAVIFVTHDLGVVARIADQVAVMYAGELVESGTVEDIFYRHGHPYTEGLKGALPAAGGPQQRLKAIPGSPPDLISPPPGCGFCSRCAAAMAVCLQVPPPEFELSATHSSRCWLQHPDARAQTRKASVEDKP